MDKKGECSPPKNYKRQNFQVLVRQENQTKMGSINETDFVDFVTTTTTEAPANDTIQGYFYQVSSGPNFYYV